MKWFEGGIPSAIQTAKTNKAVFIVFIDGEDAKSEEMGACLHSAEVTQACESSGCVAVRIAGASNDCKFFSQIYPVVVIPSTFFIGDNGVPLEVIGEVKSQEDFTEKVNQAIQAQKNLSRQTSPTVTTPAEQTRQQASGGAEALHEAGSGDDSASVGQAEGGALSQQTLDEQALSHEEKVERAKDLIEMKRQEKMRKEAEEARRKEAERRQVGQGVQKLREQQKEQEMREARREYKKDKEEDRLARQRVKEEIERDRAEKAERFNREKDERSRVADEARRAKLAEQQAALAQEAAQRSNTARIQFRMSDGTFVTQQFPATDTFDTVRQFITQHYGSEVALSTLFPRRMFTSEDANRTLQDLQLAPSAAILVLPGGRSSGTVRSSNDGLSLTSIVSLVLSPFLFVWSMFSSLFGLGGETQPATSSGGQGQGHSGAAQSSATGGDRDRGGAQKRPAADSSRQEGSVRRFRNAQDDEDDKDTSTWNGNSTQQM